MNLPQYNRCKDIAFINKAVTILLYLTIIHNKIPIYKYEANYLLTTFLARNHKCRILVETNP